MTAARVTSNLYDRDGRGKRMNSSAAEIRAHSESLGRADQACQSANSAALKRDLQQEAKARRTLGQVDAKGVRYREQVDSRARNGRLKDELAPVRYACAGTARCCAREMFGILALNVVDQLHALVNLYPTSFSPM